MTTAGLPNNKNRNREPSLDFIRGIAVILMILAHAIYIFYKGSDPILNLLVRTGNTIVFTLFLFTSAAATYIAFAKDAIPVTQNIRQKILSRTSVLLGGYYIIAIISSFTSAKSGSTNGIIQILADVFLLRNVPSFAEFLIPFIFYSISIISLKPLYHRLSNNPVTALIAGLSIYFAAFIIYLTNFSPWLIPYKAIFVGEEGLMRFPILQYFPVFAIGLSWGKILDKKQGGSGTRRTAFIFGVFFTLASIVFSVISTYSPNQILNPLNRWPPSLGFLSIGLASAFLIFTIFTLIPQQSLLTRIWRFICYLGQDSYDIYIVHIIILFFYQILLGNTFSNPFIIIFLFLGLLISSISISSLNWNTSPSIYSYGKISFGIYGKYRLRKRYILSAIAIIMILIYVINNQPSVDVVGGTISKIDLYGQTHFNPENKNSSEISLSLNRIWYLKNDDNKPIQLSWNLSGSFQKNNINYQILSNADKSVLQNGQIINNEININNLPPGNYLIDIFIPTKTGKSIYSNQVSFYISRPVYVSWTLDWEGWEVDSEVLKKLDSLSEQQNQMPYTHFINPRVFIPGLVATNSADQQLSWIKSRVNKGNDKTALHLHMQYDFVKSAGLTPRTKPKWGFNGSPGYDVYLTAYTKNEIIQMLKFSKQLFIENNLPKPIGFRAGGWFVDKKVLEALIKEEFIYDSSGRDKSMWNGRVQSPWDLKDNSEPYYPASTDINVPDKNNHLEILEIPNNGGNSNEYKAVEMIKRFYDNYSGNIALSNKAIVFLSHPQWADIELPVADKVITEINNFSYAQDRGPVIFTTLDTIYQTWH
jgi:peptidoglycan/LPS O-acetylase OafA/YrhL